MKLILPPALQQSIDRRVSSGSYATREDVIAAALGSLEQQEQFGDFASGELDALLAEGEASIEREGWLDGGEAFEQRRRRRDAQTSGEAP